MQAATEGLKLLIHSFASCFRWWKKTRSLAEEKREQLRTKELCSFHRWYCIINLFYFIATVSVVI